MTVKPSRPRGSLLRRTAAPENNHQAVGRPSERRTVDHCQRAAPAHPGGRAGSLPRSAEGQTGLKANRGMIARRALELFLASHASPDATVRGVGCGIVTDNRHCRA